MATRTVLPEWLADAGCRAGARVGSCNDARYGTIVHVEDIETVHVAWDDGSSTLVSWHGISPLGYFADLVLAEPAEMLTISPSGVVWWTAAA